MILQIGQELHTQPPSLWLYSPESIDATFHLSGYKPNPWMQSFFPGFMIFIVVLAVNLVGDGLRDALDPTMRP